MDKYLSKFVIRNQRGKEFLAEMLGTFMLVFLGDCAVAQAVMSDKGSLLSIDLGVAVGVSSGILVSGGVSGGHINPAVSVALAVFGKLPWSKVATYIAAQFTGAFLAASMVFLVYKNALDVYDPDRTMASAGIFATYPGSVTGHNGDVVENFLSSGNAFADQVLGAVVLMLGVCAITDEQNMKFTKPMIPASVSIILLGIGISLGLNCGNAINPARDLGPRLFTLAAGWGTQPFTYTTADGIPFWWIPVVAPHLGAVLGVLLYSVLVELHHSPGAKALAPKS